RLAGRKPQRRLPRRAAWPPQALQPTAPAQRPERSWPPDLPEEWRVAAPKAAANSSTSWSALLPALFLQAPSFTRTSRAGGAAKWFCLMADEREAVFQTLACIPPTMPIRAAALCGLLSQGGFRRQHLNFRKRCSCQRLPRSGRSFERPPPKLGADAPNLSLAAIKTFVNVMRSGLRTLTLAFAAVSAPNSGAAA